MRQKQIDDVGARDQQDAHDCAEEKHQLGSDPADESSSAEARSARGLFVAVVPRLAPMTSSSALTSMIERCGQSR